MLLGYSFVLVIVMSIGPKSEPLSNALKLAHPKNMIPLGTTDAALK
jgi:hypothetical protein